jgi:hypothetical protein
VEEKSGEGKSSENSNQSIMNFSSINSKQLQFISSKGWQVNDE